jgi:hypothetical protein
MASCFVRPTPQQLFESLSALFSANVLGGAPIIPESNEYYLVGNDLAAAELYYSLSAQQWEQTQDATACCENLIENNAPLGLAPYGPSFTNGYVQVFGPANASIPSTLQCQIGSNTYNLSFATNANPTTLDSTGQAVLLFTSLVPGASNNINTNIAIDQIGTIASVTATLAVVPTGWQSAVVPQGYFCGGNDAETCEQFRARVIARKQLPPNADFAYIQAQALTWPCVTRILQRTCGPCCADGQMQLYAFMDNSFPNGIVPASALPGLTTFLFGSTPGLGLGKAPVGIFGNIFPVTPLIVDINFFNMSCITPSQFATLQGLIADLYSTLVPGQTVGSKWIDALVISINQLCLDYTIQILPRTAGLAAVDCFNNLVPNCDILPVLGNITYTPQLAPT